MKDIAGGGFLPEVNLSTNCSTCKETTIEGEGHPNGVLEILGIEEELGLSTIPYQNRPPIDEGKKGEGRVDQWF